MASLRLPHGSCCSLVLLRTKKLKKLLKTKIGPDDWSLVISLEGAASAEAAPKDFREQAGVTRTAGDLIIPRLHRSFFAGVPETYNSDWRLASPDSAQTPTAPAASARF